MTERPETLRSDRLRLDDFLPYRLSYTSNLLSTAIADTYQAMFGLKIPEWRLMALVAEAPMTQLQVGARSGMDKVTVSRAAAALVGRGLLARARNDEDRRSHHLKLTPDGEALYARIVPKALDLEKRVLAGFDAAEQAQLDDLLARLAESAARVMLRVESET
ncbi:MAG: MarR family transcriptional regulator [Pacificimonas sp.]|jgi:DNA-binding MarR family transcriptional regulator|nr:MarR family transcriptional regulator [Pacificimonas sp.]